MKTQSMWKQSGLAAVLALSLLGTTQVASAGDRWKGQSDYRDGRTAQYQGDYYGTSYRDSGYAYRDNDYRDYRYSGDRRYRDDYRYRDYRRQQNAGKAAAIIGGSAAAGAVIGALTGGGKGAAIGAAVGGVGGLIVNQATKKNGRRR